MKMKKPWIQFSILLGMFFISWMLTIFISETFDTGAFGTSFHIGFFILFSFIAFVSAVLVHELGHAFAFIIQSVSVKAIFVLFLGFIFRKKRKIVFDSTMLMLLGGIVIPQAFKVHHDDDLKVISKKIRYSLLAGPLTSYMWLCVVLLAVIFTQSQLMTYMFFWTLSYTLLFSRSFFMEQGLMIGDISAYKHIKHHEDYLVIVLLQLSRQQGYDTNTAVFLYEKARKHLNQLKRIQSRKDYMLLQFVCDGYRLGYLVKTDVVPPFIKASAIKRRVPKAFISTLPSLIYVLTMYEKMDAATHLYQYMLHYNDDPLYERLIQTYLFHIPLDTKYFKSYMKMHAMYRHVMDETFVYDELTKKANDISFACNL